MPYTRPNAYVAVQPVNADDVRENHETARSFVNRGIRTADITAEEVDWIHVLAGEYQPITKDHRFTTGNSYTSAMDSEPARMTAMGLSMSAETAIAAGALQLLHPLIGKRVFTASDNAIALVWVYLQVHPYPNDISGDSEFPDVAELYVDGERHEDVPIGRYYSPDLVITVMEPGGGESARYRVATFHTAVRLATAGWHDIVVRAQSVHDFAAVRSRSISVEIFEV